MIATCGESLGCVLQIASILEETIFEKLRGEKGIWCRGVSACGDAPGGAAEIRAFEIGSASPPAPDGGWKTGAQLLRAQRFETCGVLAFRERVVASVDGGARFECDGVRGSRTRSIGFALSHAGVVRGSALINARVVGGAITASWRRHADSVRSAIQTVGAGSTRTAASVSSTLFSNAVWFTAVLNADVVDTIEDSWADAAIVSASIGAALFSVAVGRTGKRGLLALSEPKAVLSGGTFSTDSPAAIRTALFSGAAGYAVVRCAFAVGLANLCPRWSTAEAAEASASIGPAFLVETVWKAGLVFAGAVDTDIDVKIGGRACAAASPASIRSAFLAGAVGEADEFTDAVEIAELVLIAIPTQSPAPIIAALLPKAVGDASLLRATDPVHTGEGGATCSAESSTSVRPALFARAVGSTAPQTLAEAVAAEARGAGTTGSPAGVGSTLFSNALWSARRTRTESLVATCESRGAGTTGSPASIIPALFSCTAAFTGALAPARGGAGLSRTTDSTESPAPVVSALLSCAVSDALAGVAESPITGDSDAAAGTTDAPASIIPALFSKAAANADLARGRGFRGTADGGGHESENQEHPTIPGTLDSTHATPP